MENDIHLFERLNNMPSIGQNPFKSIPVVNQLQRITLTVLNHIFINRTLQKANGKDVLNIKVPETGNICWSRCA
jgi:hypothetical protein